MEERVEEGKTAEKIYGLKTKLLVMVAIFLGVGSAFGGGFLVRDLVDIKPTIQPTAIPTTSVSPTKSEQIKVNYLPGKMYFEDGFYVLVKDVKQTMLIGSVSRQSDTKGGFLQHTRLSRIEKGAAKRFLADSATTNFDISNDVVVKDWQTSVDKSKVLKESSRIDLNLDGIGYAIDTGLLTNEIPVRSLPGYTKFFSASLGKVNIAGTEYPAQILFYRIYSQNSDELFVYDDHLGITTNMAILWDQNNRLIFMDATDVTRTSTNYLPHKIAFFDDLGGVVKRTFGVEINWGTGTPPGEYKIKLEEPVGVEISLISGQNLDKKVSGYDWFLSQVSGTVDYGHEQVPVTGIVEYIKGQ